MPLLDRTGAVAEDPWQFIGPGETPPGAGDIVVALDELPGNHRGLLGAVIPNDRDVGALQDAISRLSLVVLAFPVFSDGRAYSQARRLRDHLGFDGEIRASGNILPDQFAFMLEAGFDTFDVKTDRFPLARWREALQAVTFTYHRQLGRAGQRAILAARHAG
ncbi:MAG: DUF934 domain-containing protein [Pseudomonadota bacterium]